MVKDGEDLYGLQTRKLKNLGLTFVYDKRASFYSN